MGNANGEARCQERATLSLLSKCKFMHFLTVAYFFIGLDFSVINIGAPQLLTFFSSAGQKDTTILYISFRCAWVWGCFFGMKWRFIFIQREILMLVLAYTCVLNPLLCIFYCTTVPAFITQRAWDTHGQGGGEGGGFPPSEGQKPTPYP